MVVFVIFMLIGGAVAVFNIKVDTLGMKIGLFAIGVLIATGTRAAWDHLDNSSALVSYLVYFVAGGVVLGCLGLRRR